MEKYYIPGKKRGVDPRETWENYCRDTRKEGLYLSVAGEEDLKESVNALTLGQAMLRHYLETYGPEDHIEVISPELPFKIPVKYTAWRRENGLTSDTAQGFFRGVMDLTYRDLRDNTLWVKDFKTCSQLGYGRNQYLPLDDQAGAYYAIAEYYLRKQGLITADEHLRGVVYDYLVKRKPDERPRNEEGLVCNKPTKADYVSRLLAAGLDKELDKLKLDDLKLLAEEHGVVVFGKVSKTQPKPTLDRVKVYRSKRQIKSQLRRIQTDMEQISLIRNDVFPPMKNPTKDCAFCPFNELCVLNEDGRKDEQIRSLLFETRKAH